jgi:gamma-glutamyltranspeptidase/glutathione hydrolase
LRRGLEPSDFLTSRHLDAIVAAQLLTLSVRREVLSAGGFSRETVERILSEPELAVLMKRWAAVGPSSGGTRGGAGSTTHVSVLDAHGGAAAITVSYGEGCGDLVPGTGMMMNNFLGEADINPHGFHAQPAGAPMTSMMAPTIVVRDGRPVLVLGSGGANRLRSAILQVAFNRLGLRQPLDAAIRAPRVHVEDDALFAELPAGNPPVDFSESIRAHGARFARCEIFPDRSLFFGGVHAVAREADGRLVGAGDPRRGGATVSVEA